MLKMLEGFRWPIVSIAVVAAIVWVLVVALGNTLGVPPEAQASVADAFRAVWTAAVTLLAPLVARDADGDGRPDILQSTPPETGDQ